MQASHVIGIDYGTDSVRSVLVNAHNGEEIASSVYYYPRWKEGLFCNATNNQFRQHPLDYLEGLTVTVKDCLQKAGPGIAATVVGISVDTTGSSPVAVDINGTPLALLPGFENNPNAMFVLWKDHTSTQEAEEINGHAKKYPVNYLQYVGGIYSSEWFWAKLLHIIREDENVRNKIHSFVEHCDWIPFILTGGTQAAGIRRGVCSAGHKGLWSAAFDGYPPDSFFSELDPLLKGFTGNIAKQTYTADQPAGTISKEWADKLGLPANVVIGIGAFDAHMGAVGGQIEAYHLSKVIGTSTCDILVAPATDVKDTLVKGICGQVDGSVIPGMIGMEAGQSAFGDAYAWFKNLISWPLYNIPGIDNAEEISNKIISGLANAAAALPLNESDPLAVDWLNGRRTPDANQLLKGAFINLNLGSDAPLLFKALVEATCFGSKAIVDRFIAEGIPVKGIIALGGVAKKSTYVMQVLANVLQQPVRIHRSEQSCAIGAAMFAATAAGVYNKVEEAMEAMGPGFERTVEPDTSTAAYYANRYAKYQSLATFIEQSI